MRTKRVRPIARDTTPEITELRAQLAEAKETLDAIRSGAVDALIVSGPDGDHVFSLESAETPYRRLVEQINEGALLLRVDGVILYANARFAHMAKTPLGQVIGSPWHRFFSPADRPRLDDLLRAARVHGCREEFSLGDQTNTPLPVELSLSFLSGTQAETCSAIVTDLTERKVAQEALRQAISELEHFSFTIVHDLRGPLRAMQNFGAFIEEECARCQVPRTLDYLRRINDAAKRMDQLITDSLDYSKAARRELTLEPVQLSPLIDDLVRTYPNLQPDKADIQLAPDLPPVLGNKTALTQCFSNLLGNAVKFARSGTKPQIRVRADKPSRPAVNSSIRSPKEMVRVWVEDDGVGIPKLAQQRLFSMFQRANTEREGTGLGLAIVRKVVERMGGRVGLESEEGHGSRFWVELMAVPQNGPFLRSGQGLNSTSS
ncbi:MAG: ATP-binding protein [Verrucomicrobiia bacterium]